uniref:Putative ovule protein n=1 Tax=Solanum chacoense TaxID=4108 RepID=A0A0V0GYC4_SOLCH
MTQHKHLVMNLEIKRERRKRVGDNRLRIKWVSLTMTSALEMGEKLMAMGFLGNSGDVDSMWDRTASCNRKVTRDVLGISRG